MIITISKGQQITIPADVRDLLGLDVGSKIELDVEDDKIILRAVGEDLEEVFRETAQVKPRYTLTAKQMDDLNEQVFR
ncbi:MAG: AbrB/MazE/SpoVT family DNA-binding domain-containing protein [Nanoarchaeota archaeon]|nr:AbrB/MazE/SpoVT family DNA-binding domain-containing protein [Nanoarchaeota archaeon]